MQITKLEEFFHDWWVKPGRKRVLITLIICAVISYLPAFLHLVWEKNNLQVKPDCLYAVAFFLYSALLALLWTRSARDRQRHKENAKIDSLTRLYNRGVFDEELEKIEKNFPKISNEAIGIVIIDINYLKTINDTYGHPNGDKAIKAVGNAIAKITRSKDVAAKIGGDEFAIICRDLKKIEDIKIVANRFVELVSKIDCRISEDESIVVSTTIGWSARIIKSKGDIQKVFIEADEMMYSKKPRRMN